MLCRVERTGSLWTAPQLQPHSLCLWGTEAGLRSLLVVQILSSPLNHAFGFNYDQTANHPKFLSLTHSPFFSSSSIYPMSHEYLC